MLIFPTFYAASGGLLLQWLLGYNFSVAVWVGYIALFWNCRRFTSLNLISESKPFAYQLHEFALCFALFGAAIEVCKRRS